MTVLVPGYAGSDLSEFNVILLRWLSDLTEKTLAGRIGFKKDYVTAPIGGVFSGDTAAL